MKMILFDTKRSQLTNKKAKCQPVGAQRRVKLAGQPRWGGGGGDGGEEQKFVLRTAKRTMQRIM